MRTMPLFAAALLLGAATGASHFAVAMESPAATPPASTQQPSAPSGTKKTKKSKPQKSSAAEEFINGWHKAYALVYDKQYYEGGIAALRAMGYDDAKLWYDRALAADPRHALTWSYYGMWQAEQGNILKAKDDLEQVRGICGTGCREYTMLKETIDGTRTY